MTDLEDIEAVRAALKGQRGQSVYTISVRAELDYRRTYHALRRLRVLDEVVSGRRDGMTYWWVPA